MKSPYSRYAVAGVVFLFFCALFLSSCDELYSLLGADTDVVAVTGATITPDTSNLEVGDNLHFSVYISPEDATDTSVTWSSSNTTVAVIDTDGYLTAKDTGSTTIKATTTDGGFYDESTVNVESATPEEISVTGVSVSPESKTLDVDETCQLTATVSPATADDTSVTWSSDKESVATVSSGGLVTANASGTAIITATTADSSFTDTCTIAVNVPIVSVTSVAVTPESATLEVNDTVDLSATVYPADASNKSVTWTSSDESVATVSTSGLVTAIAESATAVTITAKSNDDETIYDESLITVNAPSATIGSKDITVSYKLHEDYGTTARPSIGGGFLYAIWLENSQGDMQHIYVCNNVKNGILNSATDNERVLPFWHINRYNKKIKDNAALKAEVDEVTGPTPSYSASYRNFDKSITIDTDTLGTEFTLYFEIDQSWETNAWFTSSTYDQPAVLYAVNINLESSETSYPLVHKGWTPMYEYSSYSSSINLTSDDSDAGFVPTVGELVEKPEYITQALKTVNGRTVFSETENLAQSCIRCIGSITATITETE